MKYFLKNGDEIVADNVKLIYRDGKFIVPEDGLNHSVKYVFHIPTELELEILFETNENGLRPYYDEPALD